MLQTSSQIAGYEEYFNIHHQQLTLPPIHKNLNSSDTVGIKKSLSFKEKMELLGLENQALANSTIVRKSGERGQSSFVKKVKEKMNVVLGQIPFMESHEISNYDTDDYDFEAKINQNKEIIKKHRLKKQNRSLNVLSHQKLISEPKPIRKMIVRNQSSLERSFNDEENNQRIFNKRKQTLKEKNTTKNHNYNANQLLQKSKGKNQYTSFVNDKKKICHSEEKKNKYRLMSHKAQKNTLVAQRKNVSLFDQIQDYLENPKKKTNKSNPLVGLALLKAKRDVEQKLKEFNIELGIIQSEPSIGTKNIHFQMSSSAHQWRKVQIKKDSVEYKGSSFDKELEKVTILQERSTSKLQKYIDTQKMLLELEMRKRKMNSKQILKLP